MILHLSCFLRKGNMLTAPHPGDYRLNSRPLQLIRWRGRHCDNHHGMILRLSWRGRLVFPLQFLTSLFKLTWQSHYCYFSGYYVCYKLHLLSLKVICPHMDRDCQILLPYIHWQPLIHHSHVCLKRTYAKF